MKKKIWMLCAAVLALSIPAAAEEIETEGPAVEQTVDWSAFLIDDPETYVTLGEYKGLEVTKTLYTITDEDVQYELETRLSAYSTTQEVDRAPEMGDLLTMDLTVKANGDDYAETDFQIEYGYAYLGEDFDDELEGIMPGETRTFTVDYDEDAEVEGWENQSVDFSVTVTKIETTVIPDLTDDWVKENTEFEDIETYTASVKEELQAESDMQSDLDASYTVLSAAMENASFHDYPEEMYQAAFNQSYSQYAMLADMFGVSIDELYDTYGMTEEDLDDEATETVNTFLLVNAIAKEEGITVAEEDYKAYAEKNYLDNGYTDADEMLAETDENELKANALQDKVSSFLLEQAKITIEEDAGDEDDYYIDDSSVIDLTYEDGELEDWDEEDWEEDDWDDDDLEGEEDDMAEVDWNDIDIDGENSDAD